MNNCNQLIILGGGYSIKKGISLGLWEKIKDKFTIGLNFTGIDFPTTFLCFVDPMRFYVKHNSLLKELPLIIGRYSTDIIRIKHPNTILLKESERYTRNLETGVYNAFLCGLSGLTLGIYLLNIGEIFLLGYDGGSLPPEPGVKTLTINFNDKLMTVPVEEICPNSSLLTDPHHKKNIIHLKGKSYRVLSHYYQDKIEHVGVGRIKFYHASDNVNKLFQVYKNEHSCKIYNIGLQSNITTFEKIDYTTFFSKLNNVVYNQDELRQEIRTKLNSLPKTININL